MKFEHVLQKLKEGKIASYDGFNYRIISVVSKFDEDIVHTEDVLQCVCNEKWDDVHSLDTEDILSNSWELLE